MSTFTEAQHPRATTGRFTTKTKPAAGVVLAREVTDADISAYARELDLQGDFITGGSGPVFEFMSLTQSLSEQQRDDAWRVLAHLQSMIDDRDSAVDFLEGEYLDAIATDFATRAYSAEFATYEDDGEGGFGWNIDWDTVEESLSDAYYYTKQGVLRAIARQEYGLKPNLVDGDLGPDFPHLVLDEDQ